MVILHISGCANTGYYIQAISGQVAILAKRRSIHHILSNPDIPEHLRERLTLVLGLRDFADKRLHLPVDDHYLSYVDLKRPYVIWNVFAAPEFSLSPKTWCYPFVGCVAYRGYFSQYHADHYSEILEKQGYDTYVGGISAYSTLGWFDDPVLSTFIQRSPVQLATLVFHELAHQLLYVPDDTTFNESFATVVAQEGLIRWLKETQNIHAFDEYERDYRRHMQFIDLVMKYKEKLLHLYAQSLPLPEKKIRKAAAFKQMNDAYRLLKRKWNGYSGYDAWFHPPLNNAKMITVSAYYDFVPALESLLESCGHDLESFYDICKELSKKSKDERQAFLEGL